MDHRCKGKGRAELRPVRRPPVTSPPLPQSVPSPARKLEAGKGLARLAQAEQPLGRGSAISRLGADLELRRSGSSFGPSQYRLASTRRRPDSILPRAGSGLPIQGTEHCLELSAQGLVPLHWDCAREPKGTGEGPKSHAQDSALELSSGEAQSVFLTLVISGLGDLVLLVQMIQWSVFHGPVGTRPAIISLPVDVQLNTILIHTID